MKRILILDDCAPVVDMLYLYLQHYYMNEQTEIYATTDPEKALGVADSYHIHIAIIDIKLSGYSGYDFIQLMNGQIGATIFISCWESELSVIPDLPEYQRLAKPFTLRDLEEIIKKTVKVALTDYEMLCQIEKLIIGKKRYARQYATAGA